jgi:hypothetical protein
MTVPAGTLEALSEKPRRPRTKAGMTLFHEMADIMGVAPGLYVMRMIAEIEAEAAARERPSDGLRARIEAIFPALDWRGDHHFPYCSTIRYPGSNGPDPEPPDPCTCGGPDVFAALEAAPVAPGIDVERLGKAAAEYQITATPGVRYTGANARHVEAIAAEYARLAQPDTDQPEPGS